ncbi:MAG: ABC transporter substrate-binding protein [Candidatus Rokubacteria bacterium]|nr:ABC transporter substrate-binding protein [Candidatus Rokubacteria bacterium]
MIRLVAVAALGALVLAPTAAAQTPPGVPVIGVLTSQPGPRMVSLLSSALRDAGYEDGRNARVVVRAADGKLDRVPALAAELVAARPDVIVTINTPATRAAAHATREIPIVFFAVGDPALIGNLRPGGNVTGVANFAAELAMKRLQVLREVAPSARRIAALYNPEDPVTAPQLAVIERALGAPLEGRFWPVRSTTGLASAFKDLVAWRAEAVFWLLGQQHGMIKDTITLATRHRLPVMVGPRDDVDAGGLVSYSADTDEMFRRAAAYVAKILGGTKPGDLPIEQSTRFVLAVNMKTARAIGLTVPPTVLLRADHVVQ